MDKKHVCIILQKSTILSTFWLCGPCRILFHIGNLRIYNSCSIVKFKAPFKGSLHLTIEPGTKKSSESKIIRYLENTQFLRNPYDTLSKLPLPCHKHLYSYFWQLMKGLFWARQGEGSPGCWLVGRPSWQHIVVNLGNARWRLAPSQLISSLDFPLPN